MVPATLPQMSTTWQNSVSRRRPSTSGMGQSLAMRRPSTASVGPSIFAARSIRPSSSSSSVGRAHSWNSNAAGRSVKTATTGGIQTNLSNRPMTGAGGMARKINPSSTVQQTNVVHNAAFYTNLLQSKTSNILEEMERLRSEIGDEDVRRTLETKLDDSINQVQELERQLADINLAKDKARSGTSHEDVRRQTHALQARNKRLENEVDEIFLARKKTEDEVARLQSETKKMHQGFEYQKLLSEIEDIHEEGRVEEENIAQLCNRMKAIESSTLIGQDSSFPTPDELTHMDNATAREYLLDKAHDIQQHDEIKGLITEQRELRSRLRVLKSGAAAQLLDRIEEVDTFLSNTSDEKAKLEDDRLSLTSAIETLRDEISAAKKLSECPLISKNEFELMKEVS